MPNIFSGLETIPSPLYEPDSPPVIYASGSGATPFRVMGHTTGTRSDILVYGPPGGGKTTFCNTYIAQHDRYKDSIGDIYDKQHGTYVLARLMEADNAARLFTVSTTKPTFRFCPLARATEDPVAFEYARNFIRLLCGLKDYKLRKGANERIGTAIQNLGTRKDLKTFADTVRDDDVYAAIYEYLKGPLGEVLFGDVEEQDNRPYHFYDFDEVEQLNDPTLTVPLYFHALTQSHFRSLARKKMLFYMEEGWRALMNAAINLEDKVDVANILGTFLSNSLVSFRTRNVTTLIVLHSVDDKERLTSAAGRTLFAKLFNDIPVRIATPLSFLGGMEHTIVPAMEAAGFTKRDIAILRKLERNSDYYYMSELGKRPFSLELTEPMLAVLISESAHDARRKLVDRLIEEHGHDFGAAYFREMDLAQWIPYYERALDLQNERRIA